MGPAIKYVGYEEGHCVLDWVLCGGVEGLAIEEVGWLWGATWVIRLPDGIATCVG